MAEKHLTESAWKAFAKGKGYKDGALLKALADVDKAEKGPPDAMLKALDELEKQAEALQKANKNDKDLGGYVADIDKALARQRKDAERAAKEAAEAEEEEADDPVLLTSKMVPLLRQIRKGDTMFALVATVGKNTAVLLMRRAISPTRRKMLAEYLDQTGGVKYIKGEAGPGEGNAVLFRLETQAAGMAKKLRQALLDQTGLRVKVKVRAADSDEEDDDGEPDVGDDEEGIPVAPPLPEQRAANELKQRWESRWGELEPKLLEALKAQSGDVSKLRAVGNFATEKARGEDYTAALKSLDMLEKLLGMAPPEAPPQPAGGTVDPAAAFNARLAALMPKVKEAITAAGPNATDVKLKVSEAGVFARKREFDRGHALLDEAEKLMEGGGSGPAEPKGDTRQADFDALVERLQGDYERIAGSSLSPELSAQFKPIDTAWQMAQESAEAGNLDRALQIMKRLADGGALARLLQALEAPQAGDSGRLVKQRQFLLQRWARIPGELRAELQGLRQVVAASGADDDPEELVDAIAANLDDMLDEMQSLIDDAINAGDPKAVQGARQRAMFHPLMRHLQSSPGFDGGKLLRAVIDAVDEVEQNMTA